MTTSGSEPQRGCLTDPSVPANAGATNATRKKATELASFLADLLALTKEALPAVAFSHPSKCTQIDRVCHCLVPRIIRMKLVTVIVVRGDLRRICRIGDRRREIDYTIEGI